MTVGAPERLAAVGARVVIIVAREQPQLYDYFRKAFAGFAGVDVIVDRRLPDPHSPTETSTSAGGRRWQPDIYDNLTLRGFVIKRLE